MTPWGGGCASLARLGLLSRYGSVLFVVVVRHCFFVCVPLSFTCIFLRHMFFSFFLSFFLYCIISFFHSFFIACLSFLNCAVPYVSRSFFHSLFLSDYVISFLSFFLSFVLLLSFSLSLCLCLCVSSSARVSKQRKLNDPQKREPHTQGGGL